MIVVDTSTLVAFHLGANHSGPKARKALGADTHWAAPPHQPAEMLNVLRGLVMGGKISQEDATGVNVPAYDAAYVAVAEIHELALVTGDGRLAGVPNIRCELRLVR